MIRIAITGGIGSGKSYISALLEARGIPVYNADNESKRLTATDMQIRAGLVGLLGKEVYVNGVLNKPILATYLFASPENALRVNAIIHPAVKRDFQEWLGLHADEEIVGFESAILYEAGFEDTVDAVVMVYAPKTLRLERAMKRDEATVEQIEARMKAQMDDDKKREMADYVIVNDGIQPLEPQLTYLINQLKKRK